MLIRQFKVRSWSSAAFGFLSQYRRILLGYNTRIRNFGYLVSYIFCFSFCLLFYLDGMVAVEKYKLLLPWLVKNNMHQTNTFLCDESLRAVYFQIKREKVYLEKKFEIVSITVFYCAFFLGILRFYNKSLAMWKDSKVRKQIWKASV